MYMNSIRRPIYIVVRGAARNSPYYSTDTLLPLLRVGIQRLSYIILYAFKLNQRGRLYRLDKKCEMQSAVIYFKLNIYRAK